MEKSSKSSHIQGVGISARPVHFKEILSEPIFPWLEVLADNYLHKGSISQENLLKLSRLYPLVFHCVEMSLGSSNDLNWLYLKQIKELAALVKPHWISDHLCFSSFSNSYYHDLIPLPYTGEVAKFVAKKINAIQDFFEVPFLIENISSYLNYNISEMSESEFLNEVISETNAGVLLDVNNIYVNSYNHEFDPYDFIDKINLNKVRQIHLAGFKKMDGYLVDTHSNPVHQSVLNLFKYTLSKAEHKIPVCLEWDEDIPKFEKFKMEHKNIEKVYFNESH